MTDEINPSAEYYIPDGTGSGAKLHKVTPLRIVPLSTISGDNKSVLIISEPNNPEPPPVHNENPAVWELVIEDMKNRNKFGIAKYGTPLQPFNGRNPLVDAYQEVLDLAVYLRQAIYEQEHKDADTSSTSD